MSRKILALILVCFFFGASLYAQNLENNEFYQKSVEYARLSQQSLDAGEYEQAADYAKQSQEYAAQSKKYIEEMLLALRARNSYGAAKARLDLANRANLRNRDPALYAQATALFATATELYNAKNWEGSIPVSRQVIELLKDFENNRFSGQSSDGLAAFYEVKLNLAHRDCLWRIAGFSYIYNDSWQWKRIYEANKDTFPDPNNPDLIEPGMILKIPSIRGETRNGTR